MKILLENQNPEVNIYTKGFVNKQGQSTKATIADTIIDTFNEQICLNDRFKQKIKSTINLIAFSYPDDRFILLEKIDSYLESSHKLLGNYMEAIIDYYIAYKPDDVQPSSQLNLFDEVTSTSKNDQWMCDWMEQTDSYKSGLKNNYFIDNNIEHFYYYDDVSELA